ncbi:MAG: hypothetical protein IPI85_00015 [Dehalococcoidia bacterium]|nr:hypothetical protein [Dehalococcoidia bacterium]
MFEKRVEVAYHFALNAAACIPRMALAMKPGTVSDGLRAAAGRNPSQGPVHECRYGLGRDREHPADVDLAKDVAISTRGALGVEQEVGVPNCREVAPVDATNFRQFG